MNEDALNNQKELNKEALFLKDIYTSIAEVLRAGFDDAITSMGNVDTIGKKIAKTYERDIFRGITSIKKVLDSQYIVEEKIRKGQNVSKDLAKMQLDLDIKSKIVNRDIELLKDSIGDIDEENNKKLEEQINALNQEKKSIENIVNELKKKNQEQRNSLGLSGSLLKSTDGILKTLDKSETLASILDIEGAITEVNQMESATGKSLNPLQKYLEIGKQISRNFASNVNWLDISLILLKLIGSAALTINKETTLLQKNTLRTASEARIFREQLSQASIESGNINITTSKLLEAYSQLNTQLGFIGDFQAKSLEMQTRLTKLVGLDEKSAAGLVMLSEARGKNAEAEYKSVLGVSASMQRQKGIQLDLKSILSEVGNITGQVRANLGANPELLARAVTEAKALGGELEDVKNISKPLLQFQSSIEAELEAELLTGKQLNLERARAAALMGDMETLASEISSQAGSFADFSKMNVIQQEALASAFGLSADRLSDMLFKQQAMGRSAKELRDAGENELAEMMEKQNAQEKFNASVEKLKELFADAVTVFSPILDIFSNLVDLLGESKIAMTVFKYASIGAVGVVAALAAYNIIASFAKIPFGVGVAAGIAIAGGIASMELLAYSQSKAQAVGDLNSPATGKTVISTKEGGLFELSPNDDLVAAPGASQIMEGATSPAANNNTEILNAIHNINKRLEEQYNAIKNMKVILSTNKLEVGLVQNAVEIQ